MIFTRKFQQRSNSTWPKLVAQVRSIQPVLANQTSSELRSRVEQIRRACFLDPEYSPDIAMVLSFACEAIFRTLGWQLYDVQLFASISLIDGSIAEMQTGEGKTLSAFPAAVYAALFGKGVHVSTPNPYLAQRDFQQLKPAYELLGFSVGVLRHGDQPMQRIAAYDADVTYGTACDFGFDYLRDQNEYFGQRKAKRGSRLLSQLLGRPGDGSRIRSLFWAIVDEADNILVDDAVSPLILAAQNGGSAPDENAVKIAQVMFPQFRPGTHYLEMQNRSIELTEDGRNLLAENTESIPFDELLRPWTSYVETAIRANHCFHRDVHYVVQEGVVKIVDSTTGRIFDDRTWQSGLHQAIEAKERVEITGTRRIAAKITRQRFFGLYDNLSGMTGTAMNCQSLFKSCYQVRVAVIPLRTSSCRKILPMRAFSTAAAKWNAICQSVLELHLSGRPILIGTRSIQESEVIAELLRRNGVPFQLLNGKQDQDEAEIITLAGRAKAVTIATNMAGRGTDIKLAPGINALGGLHVVVTECHESERIDRQLVGRCARQGNQGSAQTFVSADDWLIVSQAPWLANSMKEMAADQGEITVNLESRIRNIQRRVEAELIQRLVEHSQ